MAKMIIDIPISKKSFKGPSETKLKYSYLRREYFDLLRTFPMLKALLKQRLPVKKKSRSHQI